jgi:DNA-binding response OmpR family regulator
MVDPGRDTRSRPAASRSRPGLGLRPGSALAYGARPMSILLVQHDAAEAAALTHVLEQAGFRVTVALDSGDRELGDAAAYDVVAIGGRRALGERLELCRRLRAEGYLGAIVALGADANDLPALLEAGTDDFVVAPLQASEVIARVQMALRRVVAGARARWGPVEVDRVHRAVLLRGRVLPLTAREYALLSCLLEAGGEVVSRADLLSKVWAREDDPGTNLVEVHLSRLRDKLGADAAMIETVRRAGYRLRRG